MLYVLENNGVYGLTKGQFSASADRGTLAKRGEANQLEAIDGCLMALTLGATFVARSFSGDKEQLVPILKAGLKHKGFAFVDVISPCVTFNDHQGSTKSYAYTREHMHEADDVDFVPLRKEITMPPRAAPCGRCACTTAASSRFRRIDDGVRSDRSRQGLRLPARAPEQGRRWSRACSTSTRSRAICTTSTRRCRRRCVTPVRAAHTLARPRSPSCRSATAKCRLRATPGSRLRAADDARGHADGGGAGRHVLEHHGIGADDRAVADGHRPEDLGAAADVDVVAQARHAGPIAAEHADGDARARCCSARPSPCRGER